MFSWWLACFQYYCLFVHERLAFTTCLNKAEQDEIKYSVKSLYTTICHPLLEEYIIPILLHLLTILSNCFGHTYIWCINATIQRTSIICYVFWVYFNVSNILCLYWYLVVSTCYLIHLHTCSQVPMKTSYWHIGTSQHATLYVCIYMFSKDPRT